MRSFATIRSGRTRRTFLAGLVIASDGTFGAINSFTVTVNEVNSAPVLPVQTNRTIVGLQALVVTNTATDRAA